MHEAVRLEIQLIHIQGSLKGEINTFNEDKLTIGRQNSCSLKFPPDEPGVSRDHATIQREGNQFRLIDTSKYGTFVNGKQTGDATFLRSGDVIEIGPGGPKFSFHAEIVKGDSAELPPVQVSAPQPESDRQMPVQAFDEASPKKPLNVAPPQPQFQPIASSPPRQLMQPEKAMAPLVIQYGPAIRTYNELPVIIGSGATADFVLQYPGISGRHLQIFHSSGSYWIMDLTGAGIVTVNRERITSHVEIKPYDEIECCPGGPIFRFIGEGRFVEVEREQAAPWMASPPRSSQPAVTSAQDKAEDRGFFSKIVKGFKK